MPSVYERPEAPTAIQTHLAASFVSLELSRSIWLITSLSPASGEKMSKHSVRAGDVAALLARFSELKRKASERTGKSFPIRDWMTRRRAPTGLVDRGWSNDGAKERLKTPRRPDC